VPWAIREFPRRLEQVIRADIGEAKRLTATCRKALLIGPASPPYKIAALLSDTFHIEPRELETPDGLEKMSAVRLTFDMCADRLERVTFAYAQDPPNLSPAEMEPGGFVRPDRPNVIHVTDKYFRQPSQKSRAAILIHELVHLVRPGKGHPGGVQLNFERLRMNIAYDKALANAYCYQYFAEWM
jgi:hypothetical protein